MIGPVSHATTGTGSSHDLEPLDEYGLNASAGRGAGCAEAGMAHAIEAASAPISNNAMSLESSLIKHSPNA